MYDEDARLARQLQEEEFRNKERNAEAEEKQKQSDEEFARKLAAESSTAARGNIRFLILQKNF
jgi:hypothetical protein